MSWNDLSDMGEFGDGALAELDGALSDLNGTFGELEGFGALVGGVKIAIPVVVGGGVAFGTAAALDYFITEAETRESVLPWKWLIGAGVSILAGLAMYKFQGETEGVVTIATGVVTALAGWGMEKLTAPAAPPAPPAPPSPPLPGLRGFGRYAVRPGMFGRYAVRPGTFGHSPSAFGRYQFGPDPLYSSAVPAQAPEANANPLAGYGRSPAPMSGLVL